MTIVIFTCDKCTERSKEYEQSVMHAWDLAQADDWSWCVEHGDLCPGCARAWHEPAENV